ncbi:MAG: chain-length determining protein [Bacteroidaceae bacterium]|nr:chain-length determining protein [Bacteroidaceae bacterium]
MKENFNISDFFSILKENKKGYLVAFGITFIVAAVIAFSLPKVYTSSVTLAPEFSSGGMSMGGNMESLASMAGLNLGRLGGDEDAFYPELYPEIVASTDFLERLMKVHVTTDDGSLSTTLEDYLENHQSVPWWVAIKQSISHWMIAPQEESKVADPKRISEERLGMLKNLSDCIVVKLDAKTSIIDIQVTMQDPYVAACLVDTVSSRLQSYIFQYRTNKAKQDLDYLLKLQTDARKEYQQATQQYAEYVDSHQNTLLERFKTRSEYLENEMSSKYQVYTQLSQQISLAQAKVQARTPVYNLIQSSYVPVKKSAPKRMLIILLFEVMVFMGYSCYLVLKKK